MKKFIIITATLLALAVGAIVSGFTVRAVDLNKFPAGGIYALQTSSYYGITGADNHLVISFELFEVRNGLDKRLMDYKDIVLVDTAGKQYVSDTKSLTPNYADYALTKTTVRLGFKTEEDESKFPVGVTKIVSVQLIGQAEGETRRIALGEIIIERCTSEQDDTKFFSYSAYTRTSEVMLAYNINITNMTDHDLTINGLQYIVEGVQSDIAFLDDYGNFLADDSYTIAEGESVILKAAFTGNGARNGYLNVKFRPLLKVHSGSETLFVRVPSVTEYVGHIDRDGIAAYLKGGQAQ